MKALFIHTDIHKFNPEDYGFNGLIGWSDMQFGISYISSYLKAHGHTSSLLFINRSPWEKCVSAYVEDYEPDILCLGGVSTQSRHVLKIAQFLKKIFPKTYQIYGGVHATLAEADPSSLPFDTICRGEGENPTLELVEKLESGKSPQGVMNLIVKENDRTFSNSPRPFLQELDKLPFPDRSMWKRYIDPKVSNKHIVLLSRGCPFDCTYCSNKALRKISEGNYVRFRSPENIIEELEFIKKEYPETNDIFFESETITADLSWLENFCRKLEIFNLSLEKPPRYGTNIRITHGTDYSHIFEILKNAGFKYVVIGIESGSERIRKEILRRNYSNEDIIDVFRKGKKHGLKMHAYNMIGLPEATERDFLETIRINRIAEPEDPHLSIFFPYPGTDLFKVCKEKGYLRKNWDSLEEREEAALNMRFFPPAKIEKYYARFEWDIYRGKRKTLPLFKKYIYKRFIAKKRFTLRSYAFLKRLIG